MRYSTSNSVGRTGAPKEYNKSAGAGGIPKLTGMFICKVIDLVDDRYEGYMYVEVIGQGYTGSTGEANKRKEFHRVRRGSPYGGSYQFAGFTNTYGMSCHPPAPGTQILVAFCNNSDVGVMISVLPDTTRNAGVPSNPATFVESEPNAVGPTYDPSVLLPQVDNKRPRANPESHNVGESSEYKDNCNTNKGGAEVGEQGIGIDGLRGLSSSSQRRESPTQVFGFNTPGGHNFIMDDGTKELSDTCLTPDKERQKGLSNLCRWRSAGGAQILMHDGTGMIYIINQNGSSWIQMSADGKIDVYGSGDISMHTETDFNLYCGGNFNLDADSINMKARGEDGITVEATMGEFNLHCNKDLKLTSDLNGNIKCEGYHRTTASLIDLNGPAAVAATKTVTLNRTENTTIKESINSRVPEAEPWGGHTEEQEILPQPASPNTDLTATDIDLSKLDQNQCTGPVPDDVSGLIGTLPSGDKQTNNPRGFTGSDARNVEEKRVLDETALFEQEFDAMGEGEQVYARSKGYISATTVKRPGGPR